MSVPLRADDPRRVGSYRLRGRLGSGGMGQVYLGRSRGGRTVAVKVVHAGLADDPGFRNRFADEVAAARRVGGFYTAQVIDADTSATQPWLATAYIPGPSLYQAVEEHEPLPVGSVAALGAGLAEGLSAIHGCNVVHRDLKPANVILAADGPRVIDFGIARALDTTSSTQTRTVMGTAGFMAPEQARAEEVSPATDVFALGCVLAYAATGRSPFGTGRADAVAYRVVHEKPDLAGLPDSLLHPVLACLAKSPRKRPTLDAILGQFTALAGPYTDHGDGSWLPPTITEVINDLTTAVTTVPPTMHDPDAHAPNAGGSPKEKDGKGRSARTGKPSTSRPKKSAPKKKPHRPETSHPKPAAKAAAPRSKPSSGSNKNDGDDDFWILVGIAAAVVVALYVFHSGFSTWASQVLNDGIDELQTDDCLSYVAEAWVEVPCLAAAARYTVAGVQPVQTSTEAGATDYLDAVASPCAGVAGWDPSTGFEVPSSGSTACVAPKD